MSVIGIITAAVASFIFGGLWYGILSKQWLEAVDKTMEEVQSSLSFVLPMGIAAASQLVMATVLAAVIAQTGEVSLVSGVTTALLVWTGFVATSLATNHAFQNAKASLTLIDGAHWLGVLLIQGVIIGAFGV